LRFDPRVDRAAVADPEPFAPADVSRARVLVVDENATAGEVTANAMVGDREAALAAGMNDHIVKAVDVDELFATLARWVRPRRAAGAPATAASDDQPAYLPGIDVETGRAGACGDETLFVRLLRIFAAEQQTFAARLRAARASGDVATATRMAHDLKSSASLLGARGVEEVAGELEAALGRADAGGVIDELIEATARALGPVIAGIQALDRTRSG
jgi:HPt (histidine-containing phosphotransfer) domain-containing protein